MLPAGASSDIPCGPDCALHAHEKPYMPLHNTNGFRDVHAQPPPAAPRPERGLPGHVWVQTVHGVVAGLLMEWERRGDADWFGRVVCMQRGAPGSSSWVGVEDWVPANRIKPA